MQEIRKRKNERQKKKGSKQGSKQEAISEDLGRSNEIKSLKIPANELESYLSRFSWLRKMCQFLFGVAVACYIGYRYSSFLKLLHENDMWFSEISVSIFVPE